MYFVIFHKGLNRFEKDDIVETMKAQGHYVTVFCSIDQNYLDISLEHGVLEYYDNNGKGYDSEEHFKNSIPEYFI